MHMWPLVMNMHGKAKVKHPMWYPTTINFNTTQHNTIHSKAFYHNRLPSLTIVNEAPKHIATRNLRINNTHTPKVIRYLIYLISNKRKLDNKHTLWTFRNNDLSLLFQIVWLEWIGSMNVSPNMYEPKLAMKPRALLNANTYKTRGN